MNIRIILSLIFSISCLSGSSQTLETADTIDLKRYMGLWYEIASFPAPFQKGCHCTTAEYMLSDDNKSVKVINRCIRLRKDRSKIVSAGARAFVQENSGNSKLKVQFFWPFKSDYYIIAIAPDYNWAIVSEPKRRYLWILSRDSFMPTHTYNDIVQIIEAKGFDLKKLRKTPRNCDITE